ncbi:hypothetical protein [Ligilactobacillus salivarius]|uniref:hypothetical protein n=1 Tax=Ligilactobacillus salivarius TaxID=1624 RepID=UPI003F89C445
MNNLVIVLMSSLISGTKIKKDGTSAKNRAIFARTIYELGIWSDEIVEELGAVRK